MFVVILAARQRFSDLVVITRVGELVHALSCQIQLQAKTLSLFHQKLQTDTCQNNNGGYQRRGRNDDLGGYPRL